MDSLLKRKESEIRDSDSLSMNDRFMNLTFLGYYDKKSKTILKYSLLLILIVFSFSLQWRRISTKLVLNWSW